MSFSKASILILLANLAFTAVVLLLPLGMFTRALICAGMGALYPLADGIVFGPFLRRTGPSRESPRELFWSALCYGGGGVLLILLAGFAGWIHGMLGFAVGFTYLNGVETVFANCSRKATAGLKKLNAAR